MIVILLLSPKQDGAELAALFAGASHMGRSARRCRPEAHAGSPAERPSPRAAAAQHGAPAARHAAYRPRRPLLALRPCISRRPPRPRRGLSRELPDPSV